MSKIKPVERSFYKPILDIIENLGFQGSQEIGFDDKQGYIDILFTYERKSYILEVKVSDKPSDWIHGIVQAHRYSSKYGTRNIIVICYPEDVVSAVTHMPKINKLASDRTCKIISLTDEWQEFVNLSTKEFFSTLKSLIDKKISSIQAIELTSQILEESILILSKSINKEFADERLFSDLLTHLTRDQGLFLSLCKSTNRNKLRNQVIDLLAYVLINQIIFYFLYSKNVQKNRDKIDELKKIDKIPDLHNYFNQIKKVDFKPIYDIDVVSRIPLKKDILDCINIIIECLSPLRVDEIKHDLYGKLIGRCIPKETRKVLASYYTKNNSAELLAQLLIERWDERIWDLACGSGTLLVSSYRRKKEIYTQLKGSPDKKESEKLHKKFIEEDLTGTDIMPFACHLTGLNLSAQNLETKTDFMRISNKNSLELSDVEKYEEVAEAYGELSNALEHVQSKQKRLYEFDHESPKPLIFSESRKFKLEKVDTIIINPPFTNYNDIPQSFRDEFFKQELKKIVGQTVGLWAYFLILADKWLNTSGKVGAIIPISFLRGKISERIREYYLNNYSLEYIIKPKSKSSFSEDSDLTDLILISRKTPPERTQRTNIILLQKQIDDYTMVDIDRLSKSIKTVTDSNEETEDFTLIKINQSELIENKDTLITYFFAENLKDMRKINELYEKIKNSSKTKRIDTEKVQAGQSFRPKGTSKKRVIARKYSYSRVKRANFYFEIEGSGKILKYYSKDGKLYTKNKKELNKTLRTITGIDKFDVSRLYDYMIPARNDSNSKSQLMFAHKIRLNSNETFLVGVYSKDRILPTNALTIYFSKSDVESKILSLYFSSIFYLTQFKRLDKKTTEGYLEIGELDMRNIYIPDIDKMPNVDIDKLLHYFDRNRKKRFPSIITQLRDKTEERVELDKLFSGVLDIKLSDKELNDLYDTMLNEI